jgi:hypothetical protein
VSYIIKRRLAVVIIENIMAPAFLFGQIDTTPIAIAVVINLNKAQISPAINIKQRISQKSDR